MKGMAGDVKVTFVNKQQEAFLGRTLVKLTNFTDCHLIVGDGLNVPLIPAEDTSSSLSSISLGSRKCIAHSLHDSQLIDVWRLLHPTERDFTFYSTLHKTFSCIDYFLIPHAQLHAVRTSSIGSITWSDYAPIFLSYALHDSMTTKINQWRLNGSLLQDKDVQEDITKELNCYYRTNDTPDCDPGIIWEAHKAVIRSVLIKHGARIKRKLTEQLKSLLTDLAALELLHIRTQTPSLERNFVKRTQITDILLFKAKAALQICRKFSYESGE